MTPQRYGVAVALLCALSLALTDCKREQSTLGEHKRAGAPVGQHATNTDSAFISALDQMLANGEVMIYVNEVIEERVFGEICFV